MIRIRSARIAAVVLLAFLAAALSPTLIPEKALAARVDALLARHPASSAEERVRLGLELLNLGPKAIDEICARLQHPSPETVTAAEYAISGLSLTVTRPGGERQRTVFVRALNRALQKPAGEDTREFLISMLQVAGRTESIRTLAPFLSHTRLGGPAVRAVVSIGGPRAERALDRAVDAAPAATRIDIVLGLAEMGSRRAVSKLLTLAGDSDPTLRSAARHALAASGDPRAVDVLSRVDIAASAEERDRAPILYLEYAKNLAASGHVDSALKIAREMTSVYTASGETPIRCAALDLIASLRGDAALPDLLSAMDDGDKDVRGQALRLAARITGKDATSAWILRMNEAPPEIRAEIMAMLGDRGDPAAYPEVLKGLESGNDEERRAAIRASVLLGGPESAGHLFPLLEAADDEEAGHIAEALRLSPADSLVPLIISNYKAASAPGRAELLGLLAARRADSHFDFVLGEIRDGNPVVKRSALEAMESLARPRDLPRLIDLLLQASEAAETVALQNAVAAASNRIEDPAFRAEALIAAMDRAKDAEKSVFLRPLGRIGGSAALEAVTAATQSRDARLQSAAVRILGQWPDAAAMPVLRDIILSAKDRRLRIPALEGYVRLVNRSDEDAPERFSRLKEFYDFLEKEEDGKIVVRGLARIRTAEAFRLLGEAAVVPILMEDAVQGLLRIADGAVQEMEWLRTHEAASLIKKAGDLSTDRETQERAGRILEHILSAMGYRPLFNGRNLSGWRGPIADQPAQPKMSAAELRTARIEADEIMRNHWSVADGILVFDGRGRNLRTEREFEDFDLLVDWKIPPGGDGGISLRGSPQVRIWDPDINPEGSGGLSHNRKGPSKPLKRADGPAGDWNTFRIVMKGERVWVTLNGETVVDGEVFENSWGRDSPIFSSGPIELQAHGTPLWFRNIFIREIPQNWRPENLSDSGRILEDSDPGVD